MCCRLAISVGGKIALDELLLDRSFVIAAR